MGSATDCAKNHPVPLIGYAIYSEPLPRWLIRTRDDLRIIPENRRTRARGLGIGGANREGKSSEAIPDDGTGRGGKARPVPFLS